MPRAVSKPVKTGSQSSDKVIAQLSGVSRRPPVYGSMWSTMTVTELDLDMAL
jgi:hypothetical protein